MYSDSIIFLFLTLCRISIEVPVQLPNEGNNDIPYTEAVIRDKINNIFLNLRVKLEPTLQDDNIIHNFFVSMTLEDFNNLKEIERLSQVYDLNNGRDFIPEINDILNANEEFDVLIDDNNVTVYTAGPFINKLRRLKKIYQLQNTMSSSQENPRILNHIVNGGSIMDYYNETVLSDDPFRVPKVDRRVYHGYTDNVRLFPFVVRIADAGYNMPCAGSIIEVHAVITSASCLDGYQDSSIAVEVVTSSGYQSKRLDIRDLYRHPQYNPTTLIHNVALLILDEDDVQEYIKPHKSPAKRIMLDNGRTPLSYHAKILVLSFGYEHDSYQHNEIIYSVLKVHPLSSCQEYYTQKYVTEYNFCGTLLPKKGAKCLQDVGGPGIMNGKLVGIVSFGSRICGKSPTVFTMVGYYTEWMRDTLGPQSAYIFQSPNYQKSVIGRHQTLPAAKNGGFLDIYRGFQDFISDIFSRAQDDAASKEDVTNGTTVINTTDKHDNDINY